MTATSTAATPYRWLRRTPTLAGLGYTAAWLAGLAVASSSTDVRSTGAQIVAGYAGHAGTATVQVLLTEGLAGLLLAVVALALGRAGRRAGAGRAARLTVLTGTCAAAVSLVQCALGVYLTSTVAPAGRAGTASALTGAINRLDGGKMFLLAGLALAGAALAGRTGLLPRWLRWTALATAAALAVSGLGYLLLAARPAQAAWVSLPLLLVYVTGAGIALGRAGR